MLKKKSKKKSNSSDNEKKTVCLTPKGKAFYLAVKHGLCPRIEGGWDTTKFESFWDEFERDMMILFK